MFDNLIFTKNYYDKKYASGYGIQYPEGHIIRIYEYFLKHELGLLKGTKLFDFGCGNGVHSQYFYSKGYQVYGVDISSKAIADCKKRMPKIASHFKLIKPGEDVGKTFGMKFDVVLANQVLYYLSSEQIQETLEQLHGMLYKGGYIVATMIAGKNHYYNLSKKIDGLTKVKIKGRLNEVFYLTFTKSEKDLLKEFSVFKPYFYGHYDFSTREGSTLHYYFIGKK